MGAFTTKNSSNFGATSDEWSIHPELIVMSCWGAWSSSDETGLNWIMGGGGLFLASSSVGSRNGWIPLSAVCWLPMVTTDERYSALMLVIGELTIRNEGGKNPCFSLIIIIFFK